MYKKASDGAQRALSGPAYKYSTREVAKRLPKKGSDKDDRKPRRYKTDAAAKAARGRDRQA
ncbi:MAG TPA: hypothetical protein VG145_03635, partial [Xanthobacteraceae bacterium]|nr:hypothetical protein [Xanthobacteraceae bacterium]